MRDAYLVRGGGGGGRRGARETEGSEARRNGGTLDDR